MSEAAFLRTTLPSFVSRISVWCRYSGFRSTDDLT